MNKSESIGKISAALVKAQKQMGTAVKDSKNPFYRSSYADLNAIREATIPVLNDQGISVLQPMTMLDGKQFVETTLLHESGEFLTSLTEIIVAKQNDPQAAGSAQSYARRYGLQSFLCVGAEDDDGEKGMNRETKTPAKASALAGGASNSQSLTKTEPVKEATKPSGSFRRNAPVAQTVSEEL